MPAAPRPPPGAGSGGSRSSPRPPPWGRRPRRPARRRARPRRRAPPRARRAGYRRERRTAGPKVLHSGHRTADGIRGRSAEEREQMISARVRSTASLLVVLALVAGGGVLGVLAARAATARAVEVHRADRDAFRAVVGRLMYGYFGTGLSALDERAENGGFSLREDDAGDTAKLRQTVDGSLFFGAGAVLTDLTGAVRSAYLPSGAVPPVSDAGYGPMVRALMQGKPGLSSVLTMADGRKLVALAVPVRRAGVPAGLLVGYIRMDRTGPSRQFLAGLPLGTDVH